jgi:hypothetical protein
MFFYIYIIYTKNELRAGHDSDSVSYNWKSVLLLGDFEGSSFSEEKNVKHTASNVIKIGI